MFSERVQKGWDTIVVGIGVIATIVGVIVLLIQIMHSVRLVHG
jgi:hypothetical protein